MEVARAGGGVGVLGGLEGSFTYFRVFPGLKVL